MRCADLQCRSCFPVGRKVYSMTILFTSIVVRALSRWCTRVNGGLVAGEMHPFLFLLFCNYLLFLPAIPASGINGTSTGRRLSTANWLAGDAMGAVVEARWIQYRNVFIVFSSTTLNGFLKGLKRFYSEYSIIIQ